MPVGSSAPVFEVFGVGIKEDAESVASGISPSASCHLFTAAANKKLVNASYGEEYLWTEEEKN